MLEYLRIENLILIERAEIFFGEGLHIFTGETGSGKTAILTAIRLLMGEKAGPDLIRRNAKSAILEARIRLSEIPDMADDGFELVPGQEVIIRRELYASGKSRAFCNDGQITLAALKKLLTATIEIVDQNSACLLHSAEEQRKLLDSQANIDLHPYQNALSLEKIWAEKLRLLQEKKESAAALLDRSKSDLAEIETVGWQMGEESRLTEEHNRLTHAEQLIERLGSILQELSEGASPLAAQLSRMHLYLEQLSTFDSSLHDAGELLKSAGLEAREAQQIISKALSAAEIDPTRLQQVEKRIGVIERLKRRFGASFEEVQSMKSRLEKQIAELMSLDEEIKEAEEKLALASNNKTNLSAEITEQRRRAATPFAKKILGELSALNLPHARFEIAITPIDDRGEGVRFLFSANPGTSILPLNDCASGGEMSRLLFAIKIICADGKGASCLIFDEIDNNVGGQTACVLGKKLRELSQKRQLICITHFVQVAEFATHHFLVTKTVDSAESRTTLQKLGDKRDSEYSRMIGHS